MKIITPDTLPADYYKEVMLEELPIVNEIILEVRTKGDEAVRYYSSEFDDLDLESYAVSSDEIDEAYAKLDTDKIDAIRKAAANIEDFAKLQFTMFSDVESSEKGYVYGHKIIPIQRVGCYVPGGVYPLPSSALMTVIPAKVAGVREIVVCSPKIAPETIVAADIAGATQIFNIGGAQAIAAMAFGTETVPKVDKIVGPGNQFVAAAKKKVYGVVGIDFIAGPSEVMVIADETADPEIVAADLLAQAEHDTLARCDLITTSVDFAKRVMTQVLEQLDSLSTQEIAGKAVGNSYIVIVDDLAEAVSICNSRAPEHLELQIKEPERIIDDLVNYGSLFIGPYSAEVFGDYCSGPNHTLPTNRVARYSGGLSVKEYVKVVTYQKLEKGAMPELIETSSKLAEMEGLHAHQRAAEVRRKLL